ncbi:MULTISPECIES: deoxyguanosinetriphosphate triphosphohydrolase [Flavobacteriaceae]|uniref:Deoxyguanosinetriphosphate triphosphohydrolase n=1 Tax=Gaetbulibacter jejuensis TaxID=584607 RepID=A0ABN1JCQ8_9FLAO|nr:deoxyguanosinetriphosphate triphosphohydrolase [Meridianimaribacter sp. CL38]TBV25181.1 deoxyguanosinetriphosphate triphosphohydrolase [Meridianimaribacter sp. CL38]
MNWEQLLSLKRFGDTNKRLRKEQDETRLGFEVDYDRVIFSSEFRSLQDKTQVIPLSKTDFVHTRLTHSLEVSVVGRSLGRKAGQRLIEKHPYLQNIHGYQANDFGAIVAAAALAHDIGNPPFGHSGEKSIGEFFKTGKGVKFKDKLTQKEYQDLCDFEGNANGFKILTESRPGREGGLRLSYATLGAFIKYPKESLPKKPTTHIADKKYGFFQSEKSVFLDVVKELGLVKRGNDNDISFSRHPLTYLVEAADDICYTIIDFEDGINLGLIQEEYALEYLINLVRGSINTSKYHELTTTQDRVSYLRALAINTLINEAVELFIENEEAILDGTFSKALLDLSKYKAQIKDIIQISISNVYQSEEVIDKEISGYEVLNQLLSVYTDAVDNKLNNSLSSFNSLVLKSLPKTVNLNDDNLYSCLMAVCNYISKLSDSNAILTYRKLKGNHL